MKRTASAGSAPNTDGSPVRSTGAESTDAVRFDGRVLARVAISLALATIVLDIVLVFARYGLERQTSSAFEILDLDAENMLGS